MIKINGKEYGLFYSVEAHIEIDDFIIANPAASLTEGVVVRAIAMNRAYNKANGIKDEVLKREDILTQPNGVFALLKAAVEEQEKKDSATSVQTEEKKTKNAKSASR